MTPHPPSFDEIVAAALDCDPAERGAFLSSCCDGNAHLRREIEDLLVSLDNTPEDFLARPAVDMISGGDLMSGIVGVEPDTPIEVAPPVPIFAPGHVISSRFSVIRFIARGGMGEVYEVDDRLLGGEHIALKTILPHIAADPALARRFEQEVRLARNLLHRNLCPIYDLAQCTDTEPAFLFLTMKLLSGETLADRLRALEPADEHATATRLPLGEAAAIFRQLVAGLAAIHAANVVHGDIKPNNVMLSGAGSTVLVHIMDFGLARLHDTSATQVTRSLVAGTLGYLAPEILRGARPSPSSDLYALGILLHKVLTGDLPDPASSKPGETLAGLSASDAPPALVHFVRELLADDADRRHAAFAQMKLYFGVSEGLASDPPPSQPAPLWDTPKTAPAIFTRRRVLFAAGAAAACAATGTLAWNRDLLDDLLHPLPAKRFVSIINWPPTKDIHLKPMLMGLIELIGNELARAEAFDHDLYVNPHAGTADINTPAQINQIREADGANLVLATSATSAGGDTAQLRLAVFDNDPYHALRAKHLAVPLDEQQSLRTRSVRLAADLLDVRNYTPDPKRIGPGSSNLQALAAFQAAEALKKKPNDTGLEAALEKYREAVELDVHFALAYARLAYAYLRYYMLHYDSAALKLGRDNAETAISLAPNLPEGHIAMSGALDRTGDRQGALRSIQHALQIDPENPTALTLFGDTLSRSDRWDDAERVYRKLLAARPNHWLGHFQLGDVFARSGRYSAAVDELRAASLAKPRDAQCLSELALVFTNMGRLDDASQSAQRSAAIASTPEAALAQARIARSLKKYAEALGFANQATTLDPAEPLNWLELADCCAFLPGQKERVEAAITKVVALQEEILKSDVGDGPGWMVLALGLAKSGKAEQASELVQKAESTYADDIDSQMTKARVLALLGRPQEALTTLERCCRRGATSFQVRTLPDLNQLHGDARFRKLVQT